MSRIGLACLAVLALALTPGLGRAQGPYAEFAVGSGLGGQVENEIGIVDEDYDIDPGYLVSGAGGFEFASGFRIEAEVLYIDNKIDPDGAFTKGSISGGAAMANLVFAPDLGRMVRPYVGFGVGAAIFEQDVTDVFLGQRFRAKTDDEGIAWQVKAGAELELTDKVALTGGYKYLSILTEDDDVETDGFVHAATVGVRFKPNPR